MGMGSSFGTNLEFRLLQRWKTDGAGRGAVGRERPQELCGRLNSQKVGSLPPVLVVFPPLLLVFRCCFWLRDRDMHRHKVKSAVQASLQGVRSTFFTGFPPTPGHRWVSGFAFQTERHGACRFHETPAEFQSARLSRPSTPDRNARTAIRRSVLWRG